MKKLNILRCGDRNFWAYHWIALEEARYSRHNIEYAPYNNINLENKDIAYIYSPNICTYHAKELPLIARDKGIKVIGGYGGHPDYYNVGKDEKVYACADMIVAISPQTYDFAIQNYPNKKVVFMPESIDTEFFTKKEFNPDSFIVGWAGGLTKQVKRANLLKLLDFKVFTRDDWKQQMQATEEVKLDKMRDFYHSIDVLVVTSITECQPRVVMEAMACGLPVVSTDVGSIRLLLTEDCIVHVNPPALAVNEMNNALKRLKNDAEYRRLVAQRNFEHVTKNWSWKNNAVIWDELFEYVMGADIQIRPLMKNF